MYKYVNIQIIYANARIIGQMGLLLKVLFWSSPCLSYIQDPVSTNHIFKQIIPEEIKLVSFTQTFTNKESRTSKVTINW